MKRTCMFALSRWSKSGTLFQVPAFEWFWSDCVSLPLLRAHAASQWPQYWTKLMSTSSWSISWRAPHQRLHLHLSRLIGAFFFICSSQNCCLYLPNTCFLSYNVGKTKWHHSQKLGYRSPDQFILSWPVSIQVQILALFVPFKTRSVGSKRQCAFALATSPFADNGLVNGNKQSFATQYSLRSVILSPVMLQNKTGAKFSLIQCSFCFVCNSFVSWRFEFTALTSLFVFYFSVQAGFLGHGRRRNPGRWACS